MTKNDLYFIIRKLLNAVIAQTVESNIGNVEVTGSIPVSSLAEKVEVIHVNHVLLRLFFCFFIKSFGWVVNILENILTGDFGYDNIILSK